MVGPSGDPATAALRAAALERYAPTTVYAFAESGDDPATRSRAAARRKGPRCRPPRRLRLRELRLQGARYGSGRAARRTRGLGASMDRRERQEILGQWGPREPTPRELAQGRKVAADLEGSPVAGRPLRLLRRNFRSSVDSYVASLGGPLPYMFRLREIDRRTAEAEAELEARWRELAKECETEPEAFSRRWRQQAEQLRVRRDQRADRASQPLVPDRVATADGRAAAGLRARQRRALFAPPARPLTGCSSSSRLSSRPCM